MPNSEFLSKVLADLVKNNQNALAKLIIEYHAKENNIHFKQEHLNKFVTQMHDKMQLKADPVAMSRALVEGINQNGITAMPTLAIVQGGKIAANIHGIGDIQTQAVNSTLDPVDTVYEAVKSQMDKVQNGGDENQNEKVAEVIKAVEEKEEIEAENLNRPGSRG